VEAAGFVVGHHQSVITSKTTYTLQCDRCPRKTTSTGSPEELRARDPVGD
jgi:hypothetical protein